ncbi:allophanate hydrolase subunit 1 [Rheinheimera mesophila]|uniref:Allophanate hydrolase subunit 1 n=1 Tax=Rheinheimera mesophila TaxID=1547515 RepID=A0A3P3QRF2_9GAMM|nr:carboxyltransferase domain-containing protein [Rheinheimera mesophila]RRJ22873.1 allophanate hydrolase subunit 1 [Rheinheimera mesophila]
MIQLELAGENALIVYLPAQISGKNLSQLQQLQQQVRLLLGEQLQELLPSYASLLIVLKPDHQGLLVIKSLLEQQLSLTHFVDEQAGQLVVLPVYYHTAWDLQAVAARAGLTTTQVIDLHQAIEYRVYAIGFAPGFAYLGQLDERLTTPRLSTPRAKVPQGAVAIADRQTAVYPAESPGGWNILGLCPTALFTPERAGTCEALMPFAVGDRVRFRSINLQEFSALGGQLPQELC